MSNISTLPDTAMVVILHESKWGGFKYDREMSERLVRDQGAAKGTARVNKLIVRKEWIDPVTQAFGRVYTHHIKTTLPWMDNGERILSSRMHTDYMSEHKRLRYAAQSAVESAIATYPEELRTAPQRLNGMFKLSDFPKPEKLRTMFSIELGFLPVPVTDIRCAGVSTDELDAMNASKEAELERAIQAANRDAWLRMYGAVSHMLERLKLYEQRESKVAKGEKVGKEGTFRDTIIDNVHELIDTLPKMNFSGDTELDDMVSVLRKKFGHVEADDFRKSKVARSDAMKNAERVLRDMQPYVAEGETV